MNASEKINSVSQLSELSKDYMMRADELSSFLKTICYLFKEQEGTLKYAREIIESENVESGLSLDKRAILLLERNSIEKLEKLEALLRLINKIEKSSPLLFSLNDLNDPLMAYMRVYSAIKEKSSSYDSYAYNKIALKRALDEVISVMKEEKAYFNSIRNRLPKKTAAKITSEESRFIELFSALLDKKNNIAAILDKIDFLINEIRRDKSFVSAISEFRRNFSFNIDPGAINPRLSGNIAVKVGMGIYQGEGIDTKFVENMYADYIKPGEQKFGSIDAFCVEIKKSLFWAISSLMRNCSFLFEKVYGRNFRLEIFIDVNTKAAGLAYVRFKDASLRTMRIDINANYLMSVVEHNRIGSLESTLVHEINHLLERNFVESSSLVRKIRNEGIATFSQFAYCRKDDIAHLLNAKYDADLILKLMRNPVENIQFLEKVNEARENLVYPVGFFMCLVCYAALLKRRFGFNVDIRNINAVISLGNRDEAMEYAKVVLDQFRYVNISDFGRLYMKYSAEIGVPLIFTPEFIMANFV